MNLFLISIFRCFPTKTSEIVDFKMTKNQGSFSTEKESFFSTPFREKALTIDASADIIDVYQTKSFVTRKNFRILIF